MDELELTGTLRERAAQIISFAVAHNKSRPDIEQVAAMYEAAGVPFTEAARTFIEKYGGILRDCELYREPYSEINYAHQKRYKGFEKIDFISDIIGYSRWGESQRSFADNVNDLKELWDDEQVENAAVLSKERGAVPIGAMGDYYASLIYITPDGKLLSFRDYEDYKLNIFDSFEELMEHELAVCIRPPLLITEKTTI